MACAIEGCNKVAVHELGIRLRRPDTTAIWAPNTKALLCDDHAVGGLKITVFLTPTHTGSIVTEVLSTGEKRETRRTRITRNP